MRVPDALTHYGASYSSGQVVRLPTRCPRLLDVRRWLLIGWVTIETDGYVATAKIHYRASHWGISGTRVHSVFIWSDKGATQFDMREAMYQHTKGNVVDRLDDCGRLFLNSILEYFQ
jgi:hypothetical protein